MNIDDYKLDLDEAMALAQGKENIAIWRSIAAHMERGGPFAELLLEFRADAVKSMSDIVYANPNDAVRIAALQADIQRSLRTMEHIETFESRAQAADANTEAADSLSDVDDTIIPQPPEEA